MSFVLCFLLEHAWDTKCRYHGGWIAPNIYYLGHAGCVQVNGVRIAGASGIFKPQDYRQGVLYPSEYLVLPLECFIQAIGSEFPTTTALCEAYIISANTTYVDYPLCVQYMLPHVP